MNHVTAIAQQVETNQEYLWLAMMHMRAELSQAKSTLWYDVHLGDKDETGVVETVMLLVLFEHGHRTLSSRGLLSPELCSNTVTTQEETHSVYIEVKCVCCLLKRSTQIWTLSLLQSRAHNVHTQKVRIRD